MAELNFGNLERFAMHLLAVEERMEHVAEEVVTVGCLMIEAEAKGAIGTYKYGWLQLAPATQEDRSRHGFPPNDPLLRTGELRDSIKHHIEKEFREVVGHVGTNLDKAVWQELGTSKIPPRSFLVSAAIRCEPEIRRMAEVAVEKAFATSNFTGPVIPYKINMNVEIGEIAESGIKSLGGGFASSVGWSIGKAALGMAVPELAIPLEILGAIF